MRGARVRGDAGDEEEGEDEEAGEWRGYGVRSGWTTSRKVFPATTMGRRYAGITAPNEKERRERRGAAAARMMSRPFCRRL